MVAIYLLKWGSYIKSFGLLVRIKSSIEKCLPGRQPWRTFAVKIVEVRCFLEYFRILTKSGEGDSTADSLAGQALTGQT